MPFFRRLARLLQLACLIASTSTASAAPPVPGRQDPGAIPILSAAEQPAPDMGERAFIAARLYQAVVTYFAHDEALPDGFDFDANFHAFLREAFAAQSRLAFDKAAMRLMSFLRNGHTGFTDSLLAEGASLPFRALPLDGRWVVSRSQLPVGTLDPGDEIRTLNGRPIDSWIRANLVFTGRSSDRESESTLFASGFLWPAHFSLGLSNGRTVQVDRVGLPTLAWRGPGQPDVTTVDEPRPGVVRIRIPGFDRPEYERAAVDAVMNHRDAGAILIDVRGNGGGNTPQRLLAALVERPYRDMVDATPLHIGTLDAWAQFGNGVLDHAMVRSGGEVIQPDHPIYHGRVLLLTDRFCASACEDLALGLQQSGRATLVGEATYGSTGQPYVVEFPEVRMSLRVGTRREYRPDMKPFEGVGVTPDVQVALTQEALQTGRDPVLRRALDLAGKN